MFQLIAAVISNAWQIDHVCAVPDQSSIDHLQVLRQTIVFRCGDFRQRLVFRSKNEDVTAGAQSDSRLVTANGNGAGSDGLEQLRVQWSLVGS